MKPSKWSSERDPVLASRDTYLRKPPPHRWAVLAEIELPKGDFLEGGVELPPKGAGPQISGRFEEERPRPEAKAVSQEIKVSFATGQPDVKVYVAESRRARRASTSGSLNRAHRAAKGRRAGAVGRQSVQFAPSSRVETATNAS
mmetsp:Transcript_131224/g.311228  ORF Transcript_131224/g.311228 Transcript_131224/m.311228 type:complete len:144 (-) Transcript_131224:74-505(-)